MSEILSKALMFFLIASVGAWFFLGVSIQSRREYRRKTEAERARATGTVVDHVRHKRSWLHPVVEFTADGRVNRLEYPVDVDPGELPVGTQVEVLYNPDDPARFHLEQYHGEAPGARALARIGFIWLAGAAALTLVLMTLVGGYRIDVRHLWRNLISFGRRTGEPTETVGKAPVRSGDYLYTVRDGHTAVITGYTGDASTLEIPLVVGVYPVMEIGPSAFARQTRLVEVTVPGTIPSIPMAAFTGCVNLAVVRLEEGVATIGNLAFGICPMLTDVYLPSSLKSISDTAFPADCAARFHVTEGSEAQRYCREMGFEVQTE